MNERKLQIGKVRVTNTNVIMIKESTKENEEERKRNNYLISQHFKIIVSGLLRLKSIK